MEQKIQPKMGMQAIILRLARLLLFPLLISGFYEIPQVKALLTDFPNAHSAISPSKNRTSLLARPRRQLVNQRPQFQSINHSTTSSLH